MLRARVGCKVLLRPRFLRPIQRVPLQTRKFCQPPSGKPTKSAEEIAKILQTALQSRPLQQLIEDESAINDIAKEVGLKPSEIKSFFLDYAVAQQKTTTELYAARMELLQREEKDKKLKELDPENNFFENPTNLWWLGLLFIAYIAWKRGKNRPVQDVDPAEQVFSPLTVGRIGYYPSRFASRLAGSLVNFQFWPFFQGPFILLFARVFGCDLTEQTLPYTEYKSLGDFFKRHLKEGVRPLDPEAQLVCPVDGRVVEYGILDNDHPMIEQCKGINFAASDFLGKDSPLFEVLKKHKAGIDNTEDGLEKKLYYCVIYLAPGDYHGYHSPVEWTIKQRTHFPGHLFPVANWAVKFIRGLFAMNERVVLEGTWKHGFFAYSTIGAYNVGSMTLDFEPDFATNLSSQTATSPPVKRTYDDDGLKIRAGDNIGFFNLGSSVIMVFESTPILFMVPRGTHTKLGTILTKELTPEMAEEHKQRLKERTELIEAEAAESKRLFEESKLRAKNEQTLVERAIQGEYPPPPPKQYLDNPVHGVPVDPPNRGGTPPNRSGPPPNRDGPPPNR